MKKDELVALANAAPGEYSDRDVADFFRRRNLGHWPSEQGTLKLTVDDGQIVLNIGPSEVSNDVGLTSTGMLWVMGRFFEQFTSQAVYDIELITGDDEDCSNNHEPASTTVFKNVMTKRMSGLSKIIAGDNNNWYAFVERSRVNTDGSCVLSIKTANLDASDGGHRLSLILPGMYPLLHIYEIQKNNVVRYDMKGHANDFDGREAWERAAYVSGLKTSNPPKIVSRNELTAVFALTTTARFNN